MNILIYFMVFYIGCVFGSFYLVVAFRGLKNESIITPRSHCDTCHVSLKWYQLFPIFSYIFSLGKCSNCHHKISILNLFVEIISGIIFLLSYYIYGYSLDTLIMIVTGSLLLIICITDFKDLIILDSPIIVCSIILFAIYIFKYDIYSLLFKLASALMVFIVFYLIKLLGDKAFKKESFGGGDIKLGFYIGLLLGLLNSLISFIITCFISLPFALIFTKIKNKKEVPFGPFLLIGAIITYIFQSSILKILLEYLKI